MASLIFALSHTMYISRATEHANSRRILVQTKLQEAFSVLDLIATVMSIPCSNTRSYIDESSRLMDGQHTGTRRLLLQPHES